MRTRVVPMLVLALACCAPGEPAGESRLVVWAWERPEDLRFLGRGTEIAVLTGFVSLSGDAFTARGRPYPLLSHHPPSTTVVHVEVAPAARVAWTPVLRRRVSAAVLHFARSIPAARVQIDFEVRASERQILLDVLHDVRRALPRETALSMTALASWCDTEEWLERAPVDEIVPMLFRMQQGGEALKNRLAAGGDFRDPRCRGALAISTDTPIARTPGGRRVYLFNPRSWTEADFRDARRRVEGWR